MSALGRLFRTTAFKISLAYLVITSIGAVLVLVSVGWNVKALIQQQVTQTVDADIVGLSEQYVEGGITRLVETVDQRVKQPGAGIYLVTTHAGEPLVGNVASLPAGVLDRTGVVETTYLVKGQRRQALARVFALSGGFRLLVGHDLAESDALAPILWRTLLSSLAWLTAIATNRRARRRAAGAAPRRPHQRPGARHHRGRSFGASADGGDGRRARPPRCQLQRPCSTASPS